jgi:hypothetical protein
LGASHQLELDGSANEQHGQDGRSYYLDRSPPGSSAGIPPGLQEFAKFTNIAGCMAVFKTESGKNTLGAAFSGAIEQVVKISFSKLKQPLLGDIFMWFCHEVSNMK